MWTEVSSSVPQLKFTTSSGSNKKGPRYFCQKILKFPSKGFPLHVPPTGPIWREMLRLQSHWFVHSFISVAVSKNEPSHEMWGSLKT